MTSPISSRPFSKYNTSKHSIDPRRASLAMGSLAVWILQTDNNHLVKIHKQAAHHSNSHSLLGQIFTRPHTAFSPEFSSAMFLSCYVLFLSISVSVLSWLCISSTWPFPTLPSLSITAFVQVLLRLQVFGFRSNLLIKILCSLHYVFFSGEDFVVVVGSSDASLETDGAADPREWPCHVWYWGWVRCRWYQY